MFNRAMTRRSFLTASAMAAMACSLDWKKLSAYAAKMKPKSDYPTVVIGAGLGGLCCAAYLTKQGVPVTVVEQHSVPGGYATAFDRAAGKFTFEVSLHGTSINNNGAERILRELGVLEKLELVKLPELYHLKAPGLDISVPQQNPEAYIRLLTEHFPNEADGIKGFVRKMIGLADEVDRLHQKNGKFFKLIFPLQYRKMWSIRNKTLADLIDEHIRTPDLKNALSALWGYYGLPPSKLSGFYYANATGCYLKNGSFYIMQRSQDLSNALADVIENNGGKVLYDTRVEKISVKDGSVAGVALEGGQTISARAVVSNASALATFKDMLPQSAVPVDYIKKLEGFRPSISCLLVWLGLNRSVRDKVKGFSTYVSPGNDPEVDYARNMKGDIESGGYGVAVYDKLHESYSTPGTSTIQIIFLTGYEPWRKFEAGYRAGRKDDYYKEKKRWADILVRRVEKEVIPGLSEMIEVQEAATPLTNWRYTGNTEGAIYGFEQSIDNAYMNRIDNRTPVKGLYLASAWGSPGGGYSGVLRGGQLAFKEMMEDWGA